MGPNVCPKCDPNWVKKAQCEFVCGLLAYFLIVFILWKKYTSCSSSLCKAITCNKRLENLCLWLWKWRPHRGEHISLILIFQYQLLWRNSFWIYLIFHFLGFTMRGCYWPCPEWIWHKYWIPSCLLTFAQEKAPVTK